MVNRRDFLKSAALGGAAAVAFPGCAPGGTSESAGPFGVPAFELDEITVSELQARMTAGETTARAITQAYIERIAEIDQAGPTLRSVIEVNPDALSIAEELDRERQERGPRSPLHGIPVLVKDNIDTADRMQTTAGSLALVGPAPSQDAFVVERLRAAGAVLLGKTNLSEWANFRSTRSTSGWSGRGGQTLNPYALDRNPCGSSSGSGVAVAASLCAVAVGTETDGSVVCPSSSCGVVGIKPTLGLVSRRGIIPIAHSQDTAGPMGRTVEDAVHLLVAMIGGDPGDPETALAEGRTPTDLLAALDPEGLKGARIGVARNEFGFHERVDALMEEALAVMKERGAEIVDPANVELEGVGGAEWQVLLYEFKSDLNAYLGSREPALSVRSLADLIAFNEAHRDEELPFFGQEIFVMAEEKGPLTEETYREALASCRRLARTQGIDATLEEHRLDAIVMPTSGPAGFTDLINGDHHLGGSSTAAAVAGYPNITVPAGFVFGLPVGISFVGGAFTEDRLIRIAYAFEQATRHRRAPSYRPSADLEA